MKQLVNLPPRFESRRSFLAWSVGWALAAIAHHASAAAPAATPKASPEEEGQVLAAELRVRPPAFNTSGTLRRRDVSGRWLRPVQVRLDVYEAGAGWRSVYQVFDDTSAVVETLVIQHEPTGGNRYECVTVQPGSGTAATRNLLGDEASVPFASSDFWLADLGLEFLCWPGQRILRTEMRKGRNCRVLESTPLNPRPGNYARVLSWVDIEKRGLLRAEAFGTDGGLLKEFSVGSFKKVEGAWQLKSMEIRDGSTDARTRIEFDLEIPDGG